MGRDIAAFFIGGGTDSGNDTSVSSILNGQPSTSSVSDEMDSFYSVIDRCGMSVIVDQVCLFPPWIISLQICRLVHTLLSILGTILFEDQNTTSKIPINSDFGSSA